MTSYTLFFTIASFCTALLFAGLYFYQLLKNRHSSVNAGELAVRMHQIDTMAREIESLSRAFRVPKTRGGMGERLLEDLLKAWLPPQYILLQHQFTNGARVDAAVRVGNRLVSIDAKFPYESLFPLVEENNSQTEKKKSGDIRRVFTPYVDDIAEKYIRPEDGTFHFALLYIPSENLYYRGFVEEHSGLMDYALKKGVVPVSPGSLFIYLQTVAIGLKGFALSERQQELLETIYTLQRDFRSFAKAYTLSGSHMRNAARSFEDSLSRFVKLESSLEHLAEKGPVKNYSDNMD